MLSPIPAARALPDFANTNVWRAGELGSASVQTIATAYAALDAVLPGGGWPQGALIEVLQPQAGVHEWGLVAPALAALQARALGELTVLVGTPWLPFGPALGARAMDMRRLLSIQGKPGDAPSLLWATREALQCADVQSVLAWLPDARSAHVRRLQIAAHAHHKLLFVFRPLRAQHESSPAPLLLDTRPARLAALLAASRERARRQREEAGVLAPLLLPSRVSLPLTSPESPIHALLDRIAHLDHH
jgi:protein ImuA